MGWDWGQWLMSPGFGGATAVVAASLAFWAGSKSRRSSEQRDLEQRWWEQARWAAELLFKSDDEQSLGIAAMGHLLEEDAGRKGPTVEAAQFVRRAMALVLFPDGDGEFMDDSQEDPAELPETESEGS